MNKIARVLALAFVVAVNASPVAAEIDVADQFVVGDEAIRAQRMMGDMADTTVACIAGAPAEPIAPGGTGLGAATTICVKNRSTTCVSLGGPTVTHPGPTVIGSGCEDGMMACVNARRVWCDAATSTVNVNVFWGVR